MLAIGVVLILCAVVVGVLFISNQSSHEVRILKEVYYDYYVGKGPDNYVCVDTLKCFVPGDQKFLNSLNRLLAEHLLLGMKGPESRMAVAINPNGIADVEKRLRWYLDPQFLIASLLTGLGIIVTLLELIRK